MGLRRVIDELRFWESLPKFILTVAAVVAICGGIYSCVKNRNNCQVYLNLAEDAFSRDDFDTALERLETARKYCSDNKDVDARYTRIETFKVAAAYDQVRLVKDPTILIKIKKNLDDLFGNLGETADLLVLQAVYEELMDRPNSALKIYENIAKDRGRFANAYNSWGYTIFKWKLGGAGWSDQALEKFKQAAELKRDYGWPHVNMAAVYLELADTALTEKKDLDGAKKYLPYAKTSLETAEKLLPTSPRVDLLWGHYYILEAQRYSASGLTLQANDNYSKAIKELMQSKTKNNQLADTRVLLGSVYLELKTIDDAEQKMIDDAVYEFNEAVKLDDMNITACARLIFGLSQKQQSPHPEGTETEQIAAQVKRGLELIGTFRQRFAARERETEDNDAKVWLLTALKSLDPLEKFLRDAEPKKAVAQAKPKPKAK